MKLKNNKIIKRILLIILAILIILILFSTFILTKKDKYLVNTNSEDVTSIIITEWNSQTVTIKDKNTINELINYLKSQKLKHGVFHFNNPDSWNFRIGISGALDNGSSIMKESFYLTYDEKVYKKNFTYTLTDFDYNYFLGLIKQQ